MTDYNMRTLPTIQRPIILIEELPNGRQIVTDEMKQTSVPHVFACGDAARAAGSVPLAVGDGAMAGAACHRTLMFG